MGDDDAAHDQPQAPERHGQGGYPPRPESVGPDRVVGVGPHPRPWPNGEGYDPVLLAEGDRRNVADEFRYLTVEEIRARLDERRSPLHVGIENWQHDLNIGSVVRTANAFNVEAVHIIGRRDWNRRGAMVTDRYLHVLHHPGPAAFAGWCAERGVPVIGVDNIAESVPLEGCALPDPCALLLGQEGPGLSEEAQQICSLIVHVTQHGSTRSINASAAGAIAMWAWMRQHGPQP